jgi:tryptophanyl-tRNA synthetase
MRILSGIQPSGVLHIGNYFGMMRPAIELQKEGETFYFIADYHALTSVRDPKTLRENSRLVALDFLACGLDPEKGALFRQSDVPQVTELAWILSTVAPMGLLERAHSYKDKLARGLASTVGLFSYPVLMAADILIYDSDVVPVGKDQKQHIEITRDLAGKMNEKYGEIFKMPVGRIKDLVPLPELPQEGPAEPGVRLVPPPSPSRKSNAHETAGLPPGQSYDAEALRKYGMTIVQSSVPGLDGQKMSKSYGNNIDIFGDEKETRKRVMSIVTDSTPVEAPKDPERSTIVQLYSLFASKDEIANMSERFKKGGTGYGDFKKELFEKLWDYFAPMRKRREEILREKNYIDNVLARGAKRANEVADQVMTRVRKAVGLR